MRNWTEMSEGRAEKLKNTWKRNPPPGCPAGSLRGPAHRQACHCNYSQNTDCGLTRCQCLIQSWWKTYLFWSTPSGPRTSSGPIWNWRCETSLAGILIRAVIPQQTHLPPLRGSQHRDARCPCISHPLKSAEWTLQGHQWSCPPQALVEIKGWKKRGRSSSTEKDATDKLSWIQKLKPQGNQLHWDDRKREGGDLEALEGRYPPLLAARLHAHPAPVPRGGCCRTAAAPGSRSHTGAAGRPRGPGGPASVPAGRSKQGHWGQLRRPNLYLYPPLMFTRGIPHGDHWRMGCEGHASKEPWEAMQCTVSGTGYFEVHPRPEPDFRVKKENLRVKFCMHCK